MRTDRLLCAGSCSKEDAPGAKNNENAVPGLADIAGWPGRVGYSNGMEWINAGISGATLSGNIPSELEAYAKMGRKFDFIVIHGGVNDAGFGGGKNIGTMSTETVESILADPDLKAVPGGTYASGLEHAIAYADRRRQAELRGLSGNGRQTAAI